MRDERAWSENFGPFLFQERQAPCSKMYSFDRFLIAR